MLPDNWLLVKQCEPFFFPENCPKVAIYIQPTTWCSYQSTTEVSDYTIQIPSWFGIYRVAWVTVAVHVQFYLQISKEVSVSEIVKSDLSIEKQGSMHSHYETIVF